MAVERDTSGQRKRRLRLALQVVALVVVLVAIPAAPLLWLASHGLLGSSPQIVGHNCGEAYPGNDPVEAQQCFWQAYQRCQAATLVFVFPALDEGTATHTITVQRTDGRCALTDAVQSHSGGPVLGSETTTTYTCSGLTQQTRGLLLVRCGREGDIYLPPRPVEQIGVVCGEVVKLNNSIYAGSGGVDGFGSETVARAEACFWQAYTRCTQPYTLLYSIEEPPGPRYTFVVQRQQGVCALGAVSAGSTQCAAPIMYPCAALVRPSTGGLIAQECDAVGTITVPPATPPYQ